jgi:hypothetical protein
MKCIGSGNQTGATPAMGQIRLEIRHGEQAEAAISAR